MRIISKIALILLVVSFLAACNRNYYSGNNRGGKGCGCPSV